MSKRRWDQIFQNILIDLDQRGSSVRSDQRLSVGDGRDTLELRNHQFSLADPRDRILWNPERSFNVYGAIARFFWMLSGSDRLKDIAFYEPKVLPFSDDALTLPGSDYGRRLLMPEPGVDQINAIVQRIREDAGTRRAVAAIYQPQDAVRESKDIPCAFGLAFHARADRLHMTMIMRSNAAWRLLPYNVFEFTLLGELVSVLAGVPLGEYTHIALSLHLYRDTEQKLAQAAAAWECTDLPAPMPAMPPTSWNDVKQMLGWESDVRYAAAGINVTNFRDYLRRCEDQCAPYWVQLCLPLLAYALLRNNKIDAAMTVLERIDAPLRAALIGHHMMKRLDIPGIEDHPVLLESRLNLLRYANQQQRPESDREALWTAYHQEVVDGIRTEPAGARMRMEPVTLDGWARREKQAQAGRQGSLFE